MSNIDISSNTNPETNHDHELTLDALEGVTGGGGKSSGSPNAQTFLRFDFKLVAVETVSWAHQ